MKYYIILLLFLVNHAIRLNQKEKNDEFKVEPIINVYMEEPSNESVDNIRKIENDNRAMKVFNRMFEGKQSEFYTKANEVIGEQEEIKSKITKILKASLLLNQRAKKIKLENKPNIIDVY